MRRGAVITEPTIPKPRPERDGGDADGASANAPARRDPIVWRPPNGRELLAGIAVLAVLFAILDVFTSDVAPARREGTARPLSRPGDVAPDARPAPAPWSEVPIATRTTELGPALARPVADGLGAAREKLARCAALDRRRREASAAAPPARAAEIVVSLVARTGAVHVEAVEVRSAGASELADCARRLLAGAAFPAPEAVAGRRYRLAQILE